MTTDAAVTENLTGGLTIASGSVTVGMTGTGMRSKTGVETAAGIKTETAIAAVGMIALKATIDTTGNAN